MAEPVAAGAPASTPPPAATPPPATTPPPAATPSASTTPGDWMAGFNDNQKGYVQNKGFKDAGQVVEAYINFEKLRGVPQERILTLPESMEAPEARAIWERLGTPKDVKGYTLDVPANGDAKQAEWAAGEFLKFGVPKTMAENITKSWNLRQAQLASAAAENQKAAAATAEANLRTEWGMAYDQNKNIVEQAAKVMGLGESELTALRQSLGPEKATKLMHKLGMSTSEASFVTGRPAGDGTLAPDQARSQIESLKRDTDFMTRVAKGDVDARNKWDRAHQMAYPGQMNI